MSMRARAARYVRRGRVATSSALGSAARWVEPEPSTWSLRRRVGGSWEKIGHLQFDFLVSRGLLPEHRMLDVGCGVLRGGRHFIEYLEPGRYFGIDADPEVVAGAHEELARLGLEARRPSLRLTDSFEVDFGVQFDFALAQSVFTHLPLNSIGRCLANVSSVMAPGGRFFATYFPGPSGPERWASIPQPAAEGREAVVTHGDRNSYHYHADDFAWLCRDLPLDLEVLGKWGHPHNQQMLLFERTGP